jgi:predicted metal-binding membrane protein
MSPTMVMAPGESMSPAARGMQMGVAGNAAMVVLMAVAMMLPLSLGSIRAAARRSLRRRRRRAVAEFVGGFLAVWTVAGLAAAGALSILARVGLFRPSTASAAAALGLAALWQLTPIKRRAVNGHHRTRPLAPSGYRADRDCLAFGSATGVQCLLSCGPMMVAMLVETRALPALATLVALTALVALERFRFRPPRRAGAVALAALALAALVV